MLILLPNPMKPIGLAGLSSLLLDYIYILVAGQYRSFLNFGTRYSWEDSITHSNGKGTHILSLFSSGEHQCVREKQTVALGAPHTYSFTFSISCTVNNCAVRSTVCWKFRTFVQLKFLDCVTFGTAEDLTAQCTLDCSVCCVLKADAQFLYIFNAVYIT